MRGGAPVPPFVLSREPRLKLTTVLCLSLIAVLALGCGARAVEDEGDPLAVQDEVPKSARIVCDSDGAHVLTPKVEARSDGLHISLDNQLEGTVDFSVNHADAGMGWSVPAGESERVANVPPGKIRVDCFKRSWGMVKALAIDSRIIEVVAGNSGYKSAKLDCPRGKLAGGMGPLSEEDMGGEGHPVELFRRELSGSLRKGDIVEIAGNVRSWHEKTVRVVRDGEVVANAHYMRVSDGWLGGLIENCEGF